MARPTGLRRLWIGSIVAALCATTCHMLAGHLYYGGMRQRVALASGGGAGGSDNVLGINVPSFSHFARAAKSGDYYQQRYRFGIHGHPRAPRNKAGGRRTRLLEPKTFPAPGFPFEQTSVDTEISNGPAKTWDNPPGVTCPWWIPNCMPSHNTLKECHPSCGAYCQSLRADGPCLSGDAEGEGRDCKFGYRGASQTPDTTLTEESGWLEHKKYWAIGGPTDCMTCPVGFKIQPMYGDGTGTCVACDEGWIDPDTGSITEPGCGGAQFAKMQFGDEPGMKEVTGEYEEVPGCKAEEAQPIVGQQVLAAVPEEAKETEEFFKGYKDDIYPATVYGVDEEEEVMSVQYDDGGPLVSLKDGLPAELGEKGFLPMPKTGDKVTLSAGYWNTCCNETNGQAYDPALDGPLRLGDVGEVSSELPPAAGEDETLTVLAPNGDRWMYAAGDVLKVVNEVKCRLPGHVMANTVGEIANGATEDPRCCCCARDLWVGCWGWCGDMTASSPPLKYQNEPKFRAGYGMDTTDPRYDQGGEEADSEGGGDGAELNQLGEREVGSEEQEREVSLERRLRKRGRGA